MDRRQEFEVKGTIIKRGRKWSVVIDLGRDPASGKRVRKWHSGYTTRREAERARIDILARVQRGDYVSPRKQTVAAFLLDEWLPAIRSSIRLSTFDSYKRNIELHVVPRVGGSLLQRLTPNQLNSLYADLLENGRVDGRGGLSPRSVRYIHTVVHRALHDAMRWNRISRNPAQAADPPRIPRKHDFNVWSAHDLRSFLDHAITDRFAAAWYLSATTGMRRGEVLGLRWADLDMDAARLSVRQTVISISYKIHVSEPKTARSRRVVALDQTTVRMLRAHRARQLEERLAAGEIYQDHDLVFAAEDGGYVHPDGFSKRFKRLLKASGVPPIRLHDLRHTHATLAMQAGIHVQVVSERLGHSNVSTTLDIYSHVIPALQEEAAEQVAELLFAEE